MPRLLQLALAAVTLSVLPGCMLNRANVNQRLDHGSLTSLHPGQTTAAQAVELLGAPVEVVQLGFRSAYRYEFATSKRAGLFLLIVAFLNSDTRSDRVWLFFDEQDVLTHVGATFSAAEASYSMPWGSD